MTHAGEQDGATRRVGTGRAARRRAGVGGATAALLVEPPGPPPAPALAATHLRMTDALEKAHVGLWSWDAASGLLEMTDEMHRICGFRPGSFDGTVTSRMALVHPDDRAKVETAVKSLMSSRRRSLELEYRVRRADSSVVWVNELATIERDSTGIPVRVHGVCQDVTARRQATESLRRQAGLVDLLQRITVAAGESSDLTDALHRCLIEICRQFGWPVGHAVALGPGGGAGTHIWYVEDRERDGSLRARVRAADGAGTGLAGRAAATGEAVWEVAPDGVSAFAFPVVVDGEPVAAVEMYTRDRRDPDRTMVDVATLGAMQLGRVVERERARDQLAHQAMHDALTGLPNRSLFMDRLSQAVTGLASPDRVLAVLFVDLDHFKLINDSLGHEVGDRVLEAVARRLVGVMKPGDTAARFGGDEFILLCERLGRDEAVTDLADRVMGALAEPVCLGGDSQTVVTASIGIVIADDPGVRPEHLVRDADAAMHRAKEDGRDRYHLFDRALHERARLKLSLANELRHAVDRDELSLVYQPQFRVSDGELIGVEALVRWDHPDRGRLAPGEWIPVAEETQLIVPVGEWILEEACRTATEWMALAGSPAVKVCVNVSAVQLARPELIDAVVKTLDQTGIDPANLCMEITESVLMGAPGTYLEALLGLKLLGVSLAVDDFGTGYSSLAYLRRFPIDMLKIDKGFVDGLRPDDQRGRSIMKAVVQLSEALGVTPVAEGVETADQAEALAEAGCYGAQGYFYARPQPAGEITRLLLDRSGR